MAMTREEIERITNGFLVEEIEIDPAVICSNAKLKEDLGIDSLDFVDIVVIVEKNFGFKPDTPLEVGLTAFAEWYAGYYRRK